MSSVKHVVGAGITGECSTRAFACFLLRTVDSGKKHVRVRAMVSRPAFGSVP